MTREALVVACHALNPWWEQRADAALRSLVSWVGPLLYLRLLVLVVQAYPRWSAAERAEFGASLAAGLEESGISVEQIPLAIGGLLAAVIERCPDACRGLRELSELTADSPNLWTIEPFAGTRETYRQLWKAAQGWRRGRFTRVAATKSRRDDAPELDLVVEVMESEAVRDAVGVALVATFRELALPLRLGGNPFALTWCGRFTRVRRETAQAIRVLTLYQRGLSPSEIAGYLYPNVPLKTGRTRVRKALKRIYPLVRNTPAPDGRRRTDDEENLAPCVAENAESLEEEAGEFSCPVCERPVNIENRNRHEVCAVRLKEVEARSSANRSSASAAVRRKQFAEEQEEA